MTEREHCEAVANEWLDATTAQPFDCVGATRDERASLADLIARERAAVREKACKAVCYYCAAGCALATKTAGGHDLPYDGPWHVNDADPMVLSKCQAAAIRALKVTP